MYKNFFTCFYNENNLCLLFNTPMQTSGKYSILNPQNFTIFQSSSSMTLENLVDGILTFHNYYVTFSLKKESFLILKNSLYIKSASFKLKEILYIKDFNKNILDFNCPNTLELQLNKLSFSNSSAELIDDDKIVIKTHSNMRYQKLCVTDFYIDYNKNIYHPSYIKIIDACTFCLIFKKNLIFKRSNIITLKTIENCKSIDLLGETIQGNDSLNVLNTTNTKLINISIISYKNNALKLLLEFTDKVLRFDGNDFVFSINQQLFSSKESSRFYNRDYLELTLEDIQTFNPYSDIPILLENKNPCIYTIDENYDPINYSQLQTCALFYCQKGVIEPLSTLGNYRLEIAFNSNLAPILNSNNKLATINSVSNSEFIIQFSSLGYITIFGTDFLIPNLNMSYPFTVDVTNNILSIHLDLSTQNIISINQNNIDYIDFTPSLEIKNIECIHAFQSYESPIIFKREKNIICIPTNQGDAWSLLGQNIYLNTILQIDKETSSKFYGSKDQKTIFHHHLKVEDLSTIFDLRLNKVSLVNIEAPILYLKTNDNTDLDIIDCKFQSIEIIEEDL